jgi:hypothetical protein
MGPHLSQPPAAVAGWRPGGAGPLLGAPPSRCWWAREKPSASVGALAAERAKNGRCRLLFLRARHRPTLAPRIICSGASKSGKMASLATAQICSQPTPIRRCKWQITYVLSLFFMMLESTKCNTCLAFWWH